MEEPRFMCSGHSSPRLPTEDGQLTEDSYLNRRALCQFTGVSVSDVNVTKLPEVLAHRNLRVSEFNK